MAQLDVSELMSDPDFVDPVQVVTRVPMVDSLGQNHFTETILNTVGSVQPANFRAIQKLPELFRVANVSSFWIKGTIVATEPGKYSSVLIFRGQRYQVQTVADYSNFGAGYCEGTAVAQVIA